MPWPQHFDGLAEEWSLSCGIQGILAMWLVDKDGNLADMSPQRTRCQGGEAAG